MAQSLNAETIEYLKDLMDEEFENLVETYCRNAAKYMAQIEQGIETRDAKMVNDGAHPLKGSSGNLGLDALSGAAAAVEKAARAVLEDEGEFEKIVTQFELVKPLYKRGVQKLSEQV